MLGTVGGIKLIDVAMPPPTPDLLQQAHRGEPNADAARGQLAAGSNGVFVLQSV